MTDLRISADLTLPLDVASEAVGILATRGAGKSYASAVLVEELWAAKVQLAVLDPTGVYWGLRAGESSRGAGLPITVLGGAHGDVPLEPTAGGLIADLLVETGQSLILDLSDFPTKGAQTRFVTDFAERLYRRKARARSTLHLVLDEASEFCPQKPMRDEARMVGAIETVVGRGRSRGLGSTLITQRSATLNKNVLDLIDTLLVMRMGSPRDRKAVEGWITAKDARDELGVLDSLPGLPTGTAWVWSPVRGLLQRVGMRRIRTFDSYATPKPGESRVEPSAMAPINIDALGEQIRATVERAKAEDPKELRRQIADLKRQLATRPVEKAEPETVEVERVVEKPVLPEEDILFLRDGLKEASRSAGALDEIIGRLDGLIAKADDILERAWKGLPSQVVTKPRPPAVAPVRRPGAPPREPARDRLPSTGDGEPDDDISLKLGERKMLAAVVAFRDQPLRPPQLATLCGMSYSKGGGTFGNYLRKLKRLDLVLDEGGLVPTDAGMAYPNDQHVEVPASTEALVELWSLQLKLGERQMLRVLVDEYPNPIRPEKLADVLGMAYSKGGGTFGNYLRRLKRNGLAESTRDGIVAGETLFAFEGAA